METKPHLSPEAWKTHVEACEQAGTSLVTYAKQHGLCRRNLGRWRQRLRPQAAEPLDLVPVRVVAPAAPASGGPLRVDLTLRCGSMLRVEGPVDPGWLGALCRTLEVE